MKKDKPRIVFNSKGVKFSPVQNRHYSYTEVAKKLDTYGKLAKSNSQKKDMKELSENHFEDKGQKDAQRGIQIKHLEDGIQKGLHTENQRKAVKKNFKEVDKKHHLKTLNTAKGLYRHYDLSQTFSRTKERGKAKDKNKSPSKE